METIDRSKLENVHAKRGKTIARCPVCKEQGSDKSGDHLIIYPDGRFGCAASPGDSEHRKRIYALAGVNGAQKPQRSTEKPITPKATKTKGKLHATLDDAIAAMQWSLKQDKGIKYEPRHTAEYPKGGKPFGYVVRFEDPTGKNGKEPRPFHATEGGIRARDPDGKWPLYRQEKLGPPGTAHVFEGEPKTDQAAREIGLPNCVATKGGSNGLFDADGALKTDFSALNGRDVVIFPDNDYSGRKWAQDVARLATDTGATSVKILELPGLPEAGDIVDWLENNDAIGPEELKGTVVAMAKSAPVWTAPESETAATNNNSKPEVFLPKGDVSISDSGEQLGGLLAETAHHYVRGGQVVKVRNISDDDAPELHPIKPATLASEFESIASLKKKNKAGIVPSTCSEQTAKMIASAERFREKMRTINLVSASPVLIERDNKIVQVARYDRESGIYAGGKPAETIGIDKARELLFEVINDFRFPTDADRSRALAGLVTPALVFGGLLQGRAPIDLKEADKSQSGKGYANKLTAAIYSHSVLNITQRKGGVGSLEETFNTALIRGSNFIAFDNLKGKINSPSLESFLTEDTYMARAPYLGAVEIDPRRVYVMMTSNRADVTPDLANRCTCTNILKQEEGFEFQTFPEGDILDHVRANQSRYLGAVFAVVREWYDRGKQRSRETRHDFRVWAQTLDWIIQNLLDAAPLLDGHSETQERMTNPILNWLRDVALAVLNNNQQGEWIRAGDIVDMITDSDVDIPGISEDADPTDYEIRRKAQQGVGRRMGKCFRTKDEISFDGIICKRQKFADAKSRKSVKKYRFESARLVAPSANPPIGANLPLIGAES